MDTVSRERQSPDIQEGQLILEKKEDQTAGLAPAIEVAVGMLIFVTLCHKQERSLSKGAKGVIKGVILNTWEASIDQTVRVIHLCYTPRVIIIQWDHPPPKVVPDFQVGELPIQLLSALFSIHLYQDKKHTLTIT